MKKIVYCIIILLVIISAAIGYWFSYNIKHNASDELTAKYEGYLNIEIRGSTLVSLMNKIVDQNIRNGIDLDENGMYIENETNSMKLFIKFLDRDTIFPIEKIDKVGIDQFAQNYSVRLFKCYKIEYHQSTHKVSRMYFEEVSEIINTDL